MHGPFVVGQMEYPCTSVSESRTELLTVVDTSFRRRAAIVLLATLAVIIVLMAAVPIRTNDLASRPRIMSGYESATAAIEQRQRADARVAARSGQSIFLGHGRRTPTAVLLLHGFTNSPQQFDSLGQILYRQGDNVYIPRLPHHAELADGALSRMSAEELRAASDSAVDVTEGLGDTVVVVGLSMGGTMAAWIAQYRAGVRRVVLVAPLMGLARVPNALEVPLANLALRLPNVSRADEPEQREPDRELGWSSRAVGQILRLGFAVQRAAVDTQPAARDVAILLNGNDHTISASPVLAVARRWRDHGAAVHVYQLPATLGLPHDFIDVRQPVRRPDVVYPLIDALVSGRLPSPGSVERVTLLASQPGIAGHPIRVGREEEHHPAVGKLR